MGVDNWKKVALGDVAELSWGNTKTTKASYSPDGWVAYSASGPDGHLPYFEHDRPGVVISAIGALCGKTWLATGHWSCIKNTMWMRGDGATADTSFLFHATRRPDFWPRRGAAQPFISLGDARAATVNLPSMRVQRHIAACLSAFDELIEINERRIELLEELARSLYEEWFVHFRFPGHEGVKFADSELGLIPNDWSVQRIKDVTSSLTRGIAPKYADDGRWTVVNQRCIRHQRVTLSSARRHEGSVTDKKQLRFGDVLINSTGVGTLGRVAVLLAELDSITVDSHVTIARPASLDLHPWFGLHMLGRESAFQAMGTGSTGQTELGRAIVGELPLVVPSAAVLAAFSEVAWSLLRPIPALSAYGDELAETRDLLLPRLVTGQLDISDIDVLTPAESA